MLNLAPTHGIEFDVGVVHPGLFVDPLLQPRRRPLPLQFGPLRVTTDSLRLVGDQATDLVATRDLEDLDPFPVGPPEQPPSRSMNANRS